MARARGASVPVVRVWLCLESHSDSIGLHSRGPHDWSYHPFFTRSGSVDDQAPWRKDGRVRGIGHRQRRAQGAAHSGGAAPGQRPVRSATRELAAEPRIAGNPQYGRGFSKARCRGRDQIHLHRRGPDYAAPSAGRRYDSGWSRWRRDLGFWLRERDSTLWAEIVDVASGQSVAKVEATVSGRPWFLMAGIFPLGAPSFTETWACYKLGQGVVEALATPGDGRP